MDKIYDDIVVVDGTTNGISRIERCSGLKVGVYFNVKLTHYRVELSKKDMLELVKNVKNKKMTLIGITTDALDEIIDEMTLSN